MNIRNGRIIDINIARILDFIGIGDRIPGFKVRCRAGGFDDRQLRFFDRDSDGCGRR